MKHSSLAYTWYLLYGTVQTIWLFIKPTHMGNSQWNPLYAETLNEFGNTVLAITITCFSPCIIDKYIFN